MSQAVKNVYIDAISCKAHPHKLRVKQSDSLLSFELDPASVRAGYRFADTNTIDVLHAKGQFIGPWTVNTDGSVALVDLNSLQGRHLYHYDVNVLPPNSSEAISLAQRSRDCKCDVSFDPTIQNDA